MSKNRPYSLILVFVLMAVPGLVIRVQRVEASGTVYIKVDGSINPPDAPILTLDNLTYTLTGNINDSIIIERDNIVVDGTQHVLSGLGIHECGIDLGVSNNVTVKNVAIMSFGCGINNNGSSNNILNNYLVSNRVGIKLASSSRNSIAKNRIEGIPPPISLIGLDGIRLWSSHNNSIIGNVITVETGFELIGGEAICLQGSSNNTVTANNVTDSYLGLHIFYSSNNRIFHNNFNNTNQVVTSASINFWGNGFSSGGNYWSEHVCNGNPSDGTQPYIIDVDNADNYPFQDPSGWSKVCNVDTGLDYLTIQQAIDAPETTAGHTILAKAGTYAENVVLHKSLSLVGENGVTTVIHGNGTGNLIEILTNNAKVEGFTLNNGYSGIYIGEHNFGNDLTGNQIINNTVGILLGDWTSDNFIYRNTMYENGCGISTYANSDNNTIYKNTISYSHYHGVELTSFCHNNTILENFIGHNEHTGIYIDTWCRSNTVINNTIFSNGWYGLSIYNSFGNTVIGNTFSDNFQGIILLDSDHCILKENSLINNQYNFGVSASILQNHVHDIDVTNTVNGKPIFYMIGVENLVIDPQTYPDIGYLALVNSANITIRDLDLRDNMQGILLANTEFSTMRNLTVSHNIQGIGLSESSDNTIVSNGVRNNLVGVFCRFSSNSTFYHNLFQDNVNNVFNYHPEIGESTNVWDDGYPSGGNYWSDYNGTDANHDGIGDSNYTIDADNNDRYPLMGMFTEFNATLEQHVQTICNSTIFDFHFNGTAMSFNVSGDDGTTGFCRICIPTALMNTTYKVFVNGTEVSHNLLPCSNETYSYLYFNYTHSTQEVIIIPEFPSFLVLPLFMMASLLAIVIYRRKHCIDTA